MKAYKKEALSSASENVYFCFEANVDSKIQ